jgi:hypothetical protein
LQHNATSSFGTASAHAIVAGPLTPCFPSYACIAFSLCFREVLCGFQVLFTTLSRNTDYTGYVLGRTFGKVPTTALHLGSNLPFLGWLANELGVWYQSRMGLIAILA